MESHFLSRARGLGYSGLWSLRASGGLTVEHLEKDCVSHGVPLEEKGTEDTGRGSPEHGWDLRDFSQGGKEPLECSLPAKHW